MASDFRFLLAKTVTGEVVDEVPFGDVTFTAGLNAPGGFTVAGLPVTHPLAPLIIDDATPWARSLFVERGGIVHFGGPFTTTDADTEQADTRGGGQGVLGYYRDGRRTVRSRTGMTYATAHVKGDVAFQGVRVDRIVTDLFDHAAVFAGGALPLDVQVMGTTSLYPTTTVILNGYERKGIGELLDELATTEPGFAWWTTHAWDDSFSPPRLRSTLRLVPNGPLRPVATVLELGRNAIVAGLVVDGDGQANVVDGIGQGQGDAMLVETLTAGSSLYPTTDLPRLEVALNLSDVKTRPALRGIAAAELALRRNAAKVIRLTVAEDDDAQLGTFKPGDDVLVEGHYGAINLTGRWRILTLGATIGVDSSVRMSVEAVPSATFDAL